MIFHEIHQRSLHLFKFPLNFCTFYDFALDLCTWPFAPEISLVITSTLPKTPQCLEIKEFCVNISSMSWDCQEIRRTTNVSDVPRSSPVKSATLITPPITPHLAKFHFVGTSAHATSHCSKPATMELQTDLIKNQLQRNVPRDETHTALHHTLTVIVLHKLQVVSYPSVYPTKINWLTEGWSEMGRGEVATHRFSIIISCSPAPFQFYNPCTEFCTPLLVYFPPTSDVRSGVQRIVFGFSQELVSWNDRSIHPTREIPQSNSSTWLN